MTSPFFITSTGTGVGKTTTTRILTRQLMARGSRVMALKPIVSGFYQEDSDSDTALVIKAMGMDFNGDSIEKVSPWRFEEPVSPAMAAKHVGEQVNIGEVAGYCRSWLDKGLNYLLIEGVGGVMVPVNDNETILDLMRELKFPIIMVTGSYLGTLSHTLTATECLLNNGLEVKLIVFSESESNPVPIDETQELIGKFVDAPQIVIPRIKGDPLEFPNLPNIAGVLV